MSQRSEPATSQVVDGIPDPPLSRAVLLRMADAGVIAVDCIRTLHESESNLVLEAIRGSSEFTEWEHYPPDDVRDPKSCAQYYFHAHAPDDRAEPDFGHFHTFMRSDGMPPGICPAKIDGLVSAADKTGALSHLIAISMSPDGMPERLFTTNRWVTAETWYKATDVIAMLDGFSIDLNHPSHPLNRWITAMFVLFRPQIEQLLRERDNVIDQWRSARPESDIFEDRNLEIASSLKISLEKQIEWLDSRLESRV